jgi:type I restriction enzyme S subunit
MSLKSYPEYKESHQKWLGKVPSHWEVRPSKSVFALRNESEKPGDVHLTPSQTLGVLPQSEYTKITGNKVVLALAGTTMKHVEINDFVIHLRSFQGGVEWSGYQGKVSPAYTVLKPKDGAVPGFFQYCLKSRGYIETIASLTDQLRDGQSMRYYDFGKTPLPLPSPSEQHEIVAFLDRETAEIDAFITDQEELIELLSERRTATIARAVTKGLDPNAPMKDSGLAWIGSLPDEWAVKRMSWLFRTISSGTTPPNNKPEYYDGEVNWVTTGELRELGITGTKRTLNEIALADLSSLRIYSPGTLLIAMYGATIGRLGFLEVPATTNQACCAFAEPVETNPRFVFYALLAAREHLLVIADGGGQPNINQDKLRSLRIPAPGLGVQNEIVSYLDCETAEIDAAIADAREAIALSKERRTAVISAVVTGKIDVRGLVDPVASDVEGASVGAA